MFPHVCSICLSPGSPEFKFVIVPDLRSQIHHQTGEMLEALSGMSPKKGNTARLEIWMFLPGMGLMFWHVVGVLSLGSLCLRLFGIR